ncbi:hypothetical protein [Microcoleus sp. bin38.metabat.b11b12b14.051]|uniref:hypothetical protein n=1 Tax=Microcoleus sp. bin38.metabat.b11b12b14.051 TaxID=2742709 RepID=UPI0025DA15C6|nr:hypothetical protein [Microcoleus sp. bin38.metabat.b11b12b14.051]
MLATVLTLCSALLKVEVLCFFSPDASAKSGPAGKASQASLSSGYLTIIPVGANLKLPQQDIEVNWWVPRGRPTPDRDRPAPTPMPATIFL